MAFVLASRARMQRFADHVALRYRIGIAILEVV
jgi:class 3 adenylate cyclase